MKKLVYHLFYALTFLLCIVCLECASSQGEPERGSISWINQDDLLVDVKGTVQDQRGQPVAGAIVRFVDTQTLFDPHFKPISTVTDKDGKFQLKYNIADAFRHFIFAESKEYNLAGFFSFTFELYDEHRPIDHNPAPVKLDTTGKVIATPAFAKDMLENITIFMRKSQVVAGKVVDFNNEPVEGAYVGVRYRTGVYRDEYYASGRFIDFPGTFTDSEGQFTFLAYNQALGGVYAVHQEKGLANMKGLSATDKEILTAFMAEKHLFRLWQYPTRVRLIDQITKEPRTDVYVRPEKMHWNSNDTNSIPFHAIPDNNGVASLSWKAPQQRYAVFHPKSHRFTSSAWKDLAPVETEILVTNHPTKVYGQIQFPDGKPAAGIRVVYQDSLTGYSEREHDTDAYHQTWTDSQGRYEVDIFSDIGSDGRVSTFSIYLFPEIPGWVPSQLPVGRFPANGEPYRMDMELRKPTVIRGTVTKDHLQRGKTPVGEVEMALTGYLVNNWMMSGRPVFGESWVQKTNEHGEFCFEVGPGFYLLQGDNRRIWASHFEVNEQEEIVVDLEMPRNDMNGTDTNDSDHLNPTSGNRLPKVTGRLVRAEDGMPLAHYQFHFQPVQILESVENEQIRTKDISSLWMIGWTDADGYFEYLGQVYDNADTLLHYGVDYSLRLQPKDTDGWKVDPPYPDPGEIHLFRVNQPEEAQLQDISVPRSKYEPAWHQRPVMTHNTLAEECMKNLLRAQELAQTNNQKIVFLLTHTTSSNTFDHDLFRQAFYDDPEIRAVSRNYQLLVLWQNVRSASWDREKLAPIAEKLGIILDDTTDSILCVLDSGGKLLEMVPFTSIIESADKINSAKLIELLQRHGTE